MQSLYVMICNHSAIIIHILAILERNHFRSCLFIYYLISTKMGLKHLQGFEDFKCVHGFEIEQRERGFYCARTDRRTDGQTNSLTDSFYCAQTDGRTNGQTNSQTDRLYCARTDRLFIAHLQTDEQMDRQTAGQTDNANYNIDKMRYIMSSNSQWFQTCRPSNFKVWTKSLS